MIFKSLNPIISSCHTISCPAPLAQGNTRKHIIRTPLPPPRSTSKGCASSPLVMDSLPPLVTKGYPEQCDVMRCGPHRTNMAKAKMTSPSKYNAQLDLFSALPQESAEPTAVPHSSEGEAGQECIPQLHLPLFQNPWHLLSVSICSFPTPHPLVTMLIPFGSGSVISSSVFSLFPIFLCPSSVLGLLPFQDSSLNPILFQPPYPLVLNCLVTRATPFLPPLFPSPAPHGLSSPPLQFPVFDNTHGRRSSNLVLVCSCNSQNAISGKRPHVLKYGNPVLPPIKSSYRLLHTSLFSFPPWFLLIMWPWLYLFGFTPRVPPQLFWFHTQGVPLILVQGPMTS